MENEMEYKTEAKVKEHSLDVDEKCHRFRPTYQTTTF